MNASPAARWSRFTGPALILLAAAVATAPQLIHGNSCGHDFDFHLVSWLDCLNSWRHLTPYPHWSPSPNFGAGEPRFIFYPPLTWMLGAAMGLVLPWQLVPIALTFLLLAATGLATRALARTALADAPATLAGCAALFSGYALFTAYERSAFGEMTGGFWIPLLLLLILLLDRRRPACGDPGLRNRHPSGDLSPIPAWKRAFDGSTTLLALVVAGAWFSNVPLGVMASYLLAAVALAVALVSKSWAPIFRASVAAVMGIGLAAIFLLPAVWEQRWIDIRQATGDAGEMIENSFLFARHANPLLKEHDIELMRVSLIAVTMIAVALAGLLISRMRKTLPAPRRWWIPLALIPVAILLLQFPISLPVWNLLPKLRFLQFPWRWLVVLEAPMAIFFAAAVWPRNAAPRWRRFAVVAVCAAVFLAATATAGKFFFQPCDDEAAVAPMMDAYRTGAGFQGIDEYAPVGADDTMVATGLPDACLVTDPDTELGILDTPGANPDWWVEQGSCEATFAAAANPGKASPEHLHIVAVTPHPGYLILRLRIYPAWRVLVNGRPAGPLPQRDDGLMAVPVPEGPVDLRVDWTTTSDAIAGRWLSVLALLLLTVLWFLERKLARPRLS